MWSNQNINSTQIGETPGIVWDLSEYEEIVKNIHYCPNLWYVSQSQDCFKV
jgi:hypothetical protein